jgi:hypothetical protein
MGRTQTTHETDQSRERLLRRATTLAALAIPRPVCGEVLQSNYGWMRAEDLEQIAEGWRSLLRDSFAARLDEAMSHAETRHWSLLRLPGFQPVDLPADYRHRVAERLQHDA